MRCDAIAFHVRIQFPGLSICLGFLFIYLLGTLKQVTQGRQAAYSMVILGKRTKWER